MSPLFVFLYYRTPIIINVNDSSAPVELNIDELDISENVPGETILLKAQECISKIGNIITL